MNEIREIMADVNNRFDYHVINLDIGENIIPNLGIELYYNRSDNPLYDPRWESNLRWLEEKKWCLPWKTEGLLNFPGKHMVTHLYRLHYLNALNHVKIVFKKSEKTSVKAYFGTYIRETVMQAGNP